ncbi:MAG: fibronectin type III domain-containing protein, partial [Muribaculaceae bacterium]|nr:fibronectin type III domain-containing protein [Muribaculaceae bacterium]
MKKLVHSFLALLALLPATASAQPHLRSFQGQTSTPETAKHVSLSATEAYRKPSFINAAKAHSQGMQRTSPVPARAGDGTTLYGEVTYSNSMNVPSADAIQWGLYSFKASENTSFTQLVLHNTLCANGGGAYRKGKLHFTSYYEDMSGELGYLYFCTMDLANYTIDRKALYPDSYGSIGVDMTYDPVGDVLYTVSYDPSDINLSTYMLAAIDINTGYATEVAEIARMSAIACDNMGQLWGIRYSDGMLVKIDKLNASTTVVGSTGVNPIYNGSATFDFETGKLYWTTDERTTDVPGLYEINTTTGKADLVTLYPDGEHVSSLYIPRADDITNLGPVTNISATFNGAATEGTLSATAPAKDKAGNDLSGNVTIAGYIDGMLVFSQPTEPGATVNHTITLAQGPHTFEAVATHPTAGRSDRASISFYVGYDGPAAVTDLTVTKTDATHARITWETPTAGANGGTINPALVFYKIVRMPDGVVVNDEATGNEYTDEIRSDILRPYFYEVTGYYRNIEGETATSNAVEF